MLHEVLLALSGCPSPLFDEKLDTNSDHGFPLLSTSERALLQNIGRLSELHRKLQRQLERIKSAHTSIVCRAVAVSMQQTHLGRFQQRILDVEKSILKKDATMVGAYDIVPLAGVVGRFDDWHRRMAWYWDLACFMTPEGGTPDRVAAPATGPQIMDKLRIESQTGFSDLAEASTELSRFAETAWIKLLSSWVINGKLSEFGANDFFIHQTSPGAQIFKVNQSLVPSFVTPETAGSILFTGKSLHQVQQLRQSGQNLVCAAGNSSGNPDLAKTHSRALSSIALPILASQLSRTISDIRLSLSQNVLQHLLPMSTTRCLLACLRQFFLFDRGEFATALVAESEKRVQIKKQVQGRLLHQDPAKALQGLSMRDGELHQTLQQAWRTLLATEDDVADEVSDFAQQRISLQTITPNKAQPTSISSVQSTEIPAITTVDFNDLLFPNPTELSMSITSPLDLFLTPGDVETYSAINAYLLAIRRGCLRLSDLWRRTPARRIAAASSFAASGGRDRLRQREIASRKVWATCSAANFMLSETAAFFESEIIRGSCDHFQLWVEQPATHDLTEDNSEHKQAQRDPETLATGHRAFLASLAYVLLLTDVPYTKELRSLLGNIDSLIAFFNRQLDLQQKLDMEAESGEESPHTVEDERRIALELDRARKKVDSDLKSIVYRLRQLDEERIGSLRYLDLRPSDHAGFEPWKAGGVDRLLMKLEFGRMLEPGASLV